MAVDAATIEGADTWKRRPRDAIDVAVLAAELR